MNISLTSSYRNMPSSSKVCTFRKHLIFRSMKNNSLCSREPVMPKPLLVVKVTWSSRSSFRNHARTPNKMYDTRDDVVQDLPCRPSFQSSVRECQFRKSFVIPHSAFQSPKNTWLAFNWGVSIKCKIVLVLRNACH